MDNINQMFLSELSKAYSLERVRAIFDGFSAYRVKIKEDCVYLLLNDDFSISHDIDTTLETISSHEKSEKHGASYLILMAKENPKKKQCTNFNGRSFAHFIFCDKTTKNLVFDKDFYYSGSKAVKKLIDIYQDCFPLYRN